MPNAFWDPTRLKTTSFSFFFLSFPPFVSPGPYFSENYLFFLPPPPPFILRMDPFVMCGFTPPCPNGLGLFAAFALASFSLLIFYFIIIITIIIIIITYVYIL